jgi:hypothetical protein
MGPAKRSDMQTVEIDILDKNNLVEVAKKVNNYSIQELITLVADSFHCGEILFIHIQPTHGRSDGHMSYIKVPIEVASDQLRKYLMTEEAWRGNG